MIEFPPLCDAAERNLAPANVQQSVAVNRASLRISFSETTGQSIISCPRLSLSLEPSHAILKCLRLPLDKDASRCDFLKCPPQTNYPLSRCHSLDVISVTVFTEKKVQPLLPHLLILWKLHHDVSGVFGRGANPVGLHCLHHGNPLDVPKPHKHLRLVA